MPATTQCKIQATRFAVIRDFRPARIERELLAQVFDIAERGSVAGAIGDQERGTTEVRQAGDTVDQAVGDPSIGAGVLEHADALEAVA